MGSDSQKSGQHALKMGLVGFRSDTLMVDLLKARRGPVKWEAGPFVEADALWVNGEHAQLIRQGFVRVPSYDPTRPATLLDLKELARPVAFALPLPSPHICPPSLFDPHSPPSVSAVLHKFEVALQPLAAQLEIARLLAARRYQLSSAVYHLLDGGRLVGVVDLDGDVGLSPGLTAAEVARAEWGGRPAGAHRIPPGFAAVPVSQVMWQYVMRCNEDLLPERYGRSRIYFRGPPRVEQRLIREAHMVCLSQLGAGARTLAELQDATGLARDEIVKALAALYVAGSITTHARKAAWLPRPHSMAAATSGNVGNTVSPSIFDHEAVAAAEALAATRPIPRSDALTAPAALSLDRGKRRLPGTD